MTDIIPVITEGVSESNVKAYLFITHHQALRASKPRRITVGVVNDAGKLYKLEIGPNYLEVTAQGLSLNEIYIFAFASLIREMRGPNYLTQ